MLQMLKNNINTTEYWNDIYAKHKESEFTPEDYFKFEYISHHIVDGTRVLDLGCGPGEFCRIVKNYAPKCQVVGLDFSEAGIKRAREDYGRLGIEFVVGDVTNTSFKGNVFDYVVCSETLEHLSEPDLLIKEIARILKPDGKLILTTPFHDHIPSEQHVWMFNYQDVEQMLFKYFRFYWVFPWASGRSEIRFKESGKLLYPRGNWDTIMVLAIK